MGNKEKNAAVERVNEENVVSETPSLTPFDILDNSVGLDKLLERAQAGFDNEDAVEFNSLSHGVWQSVSGLSEPLVAFDLLITEANQVKSPTRRLEFYKTALPGVCKAVSSLPPAAQLPALGLLLDASPREAGDQHELDKRLLGYWNSVPKTAAKLVPGTGFTRLFSDCISKDPELARFVCLRLSAFITADRLFNEEMELCRSVLVGLGGKSPEVASKAFDACRSEGSRNLVREHLPFLSKVARNSEVALDCISFISSNELNKLSVLEASDAFTKGTPNYLRTVSQWLGAVEDSELVDSKGFLKLNLGRDILPQLKETAVTAFSRKVNIRKRVLMGMASDDAMLSKFIRIYGTMPDSSREMVHTVLHASARYKRSLKHSRDNQLALEKMGGSLYSSVQALESELDWRFWSGKVRPEVLDNAVSSTSTRQPEYNNYDSYSEFAEHKQAILQVCDRTADLLALKDLLFNAGISKSPENIQESLITEFYRVLAVKALESTNSEDEKLLKAMRYSGKRLIAKSLSRIMPLGKKDFEGVSDLLEVNKIREAMELEKSNRFLPLLQALKAREAELSAFVSTLLPAEQEIAEAISWMRRELSEVSDVIYSELSDAVDRKDYKRRTVTVEFVNRFEKPIDFLMLGNIRKSCIALNVPANAQFDGSYDVLEPEFEKAMFYYFWDAGTKGAVIRSPMDRVESKGKPIGHAIFHLDADYGVSVLGCNGFYLEKGYRDKRTYFELLRLFAGISEEAGFDELRVSTSTLQDLETKQLFMELEPGPGKTSKITDLGGMKATFWLSGNTRKLSTIPLSENFKPPYFIADFFLDVGIQPGEGQSLNKLLQGNREFISVRSSEEAEEEFSTRSEYFVGRELDLMLRQLRNSDQKLTRMMNSKYASLGGEKELACFMLKKTLGREGQGLLAKEISSSLGLTKKQSSRLASSFLDGKVRQDDYKHSSALLNALVNKPVFTHKGKTVSLKWMMEACCIGHETRKPIEFVYVPLEKGEKFSALLNSSYQWLVNTGRIRAEDFSKEGLWKSSSFAGVGLLPHAEKNYVVAYEGSMSVNRISMNELVYALPMVFALNVLEQSIGEYLSKKDAEGYAMKQALVSHFIIHSLDHARAYHPMNGFDFFKWLAYPGIFNMASDSEDYLICLASLFALETVMGKKEFRGKALPEIFGALEKNEPLEPVFSKYFDQH